MAFKKFSADWIYPVSAAPVQNGVVVVDADGKILAIEDRQQHDPASVDVRPGAIVPGFINTHCHLELSHMLGKVDTGTGLIAFITNVVTRREAPAEQIAEAISRAEQDMLGSGVVALGDISNTTDTFALKAKGNMRYHTFVELFDFLQESGTDKAMQDWTAVYEQLETAPGSSKSLTPHAPYSVSPALFRRIQAFNGEAGINISIHNQETPPENELFIKGTGEFYDFYGRFGISLEHFRPTGKGSIYTALANLSPENRNLFVHNTLTSPEEIRDAQIWSPYTYWASCPNANLYIENRLPNYAHFIAAGAKVCLGTDSLTSNWQLSILEEMKTIARYQSYVPFEDLLRWATLNGAEALGFDDTLGSLEIGKTPGLVWLSDFEPHAPLAAAVQAQRIA